jgi:hypothetical protein
MRCRNDSASVPSNSKPGVLPGLLRAHLCNDKNEYLYEDSGSEPPRKTKGVRLSKRLQLCENVSQRPREVQREA